MEENAWRKRFSENKERGEHEPPDSWRERQNWRDEVAVAEAWLEREQGLIKGGLTPDEARKKVEFERKVEHQVDDKEKVAAQEERIENLREKARRKALGPPEDKHPEEER